MRRSIFYQPLAVFLAVILLPPFSWITGAGEASPASLKGQIVITACGPDAGRIIQDLGSDCGPNWANTADVQQFESEMVSAWLTAHKLPQSDKSIIYQLGRLDLRSELRGFMVAKLLDIINSTTRNAHEQALYLGLQKKVQQYEIEMYQAAIDEHKRWYDDPCHWVPDPVLAVQYQLHYDGTPFCVLGQAPANYAPAYDYFIAHGLVKSSYGKAISKQLNGPLVQAHTGIGMGVAVGAVALPAATVTGLIVAATVFKSIKDIMPFAFRAFISTAASGPLLSEGGTAAVTGGLVFLFVLTGVIAGFQIFSSSQNDQDIAKLNSELANATTNLPLLTEFAKSSLGKYKISTAFTALTLPEFSSTQPLPVRQDTDLVFMVTYPGESPVAKPSLGYWDWAGSRWAASPSGGWLVQDGVTHGHTAPDGSWVPSIPVSGISPTMHFTGWDTKPYSASVVGTNFLITKGDPASTDEACPADPVTGVGIFQKWGRCRDCRQGNGIPRSPSRVHQRCVGNLVVQRSAEYVSNHGNRFTDPKHHGKRRLTQRHHVHIWQSGQAQRVHLKPGRLPHHPDRHQQYRDGHPKLYFDPRQCSGFQFAKHRGLYRG